MWPGRPTTTAWGGTTVPAGIRGPSPRMQPSPSTEPGIRMVPLPISHRLPTLAPMTWQRCPNTVRWPITTGWAAVPTTVEFSSTAEWLPIDAVASWERTTAPWARTTPAPIQAVPRISADSAITGAGTSGQAWLKLTAHLHAPSSSPPPPGPLVAGSLAVAGPDADRAELQRNLNQDQLSVIDPGQPQLLGPGQLGRVASAQGLLPEPQLTVQHVQV